MNTISTASALPRTPADVNGMLSIVFVGAKKLNFKICREYVLSLKTKGVGFYCMAKRP